MAHLNEVRLIGRLTRDPEIRQIPSGQNVTNFSLATSRKYKDSSGMLREETAFVDISCWARLAEIVYNNLRKGRQVFVGGRLRFESWDDRDTGKKRSKLTVVADNVQFLDPKDHQGGGSGGGGNYGGQSSYGGGNDYQSGGGGGEWSPPMPEDSGGAPDWNQPPMDEPPF
ncbi:single-stranded DNA-binding protein [Candidatus Uabimicrobium amorphum]|uniref:Single-stranded DNA-binding protein n=1 Tax=Uabimicrobium amorphum TaxID=2596890 RepID=A0A5S9F1Z6_UABAM|nr:single-stranded DNA-binding protein [Candidatus Uabimicrobium amorphum]BBM83135.1 single-stranded DNA-binding protein 1 [Candidatus Uabimicrobium amorphum]